MSFSDQYRGTEWGPSADPPGDPLPPRSPRGGLLSKILAILAIVAVIGGVGAGGLFLLSNNQAGASPSPTASPTPRPSPTVALQRFLKLSANPRLSYHMKFSMLVDTAGTDVDMRGDMDVSGSDFKGTVTLKSGSDVVRLEMIEKAGKTYGRTPGGRWRLLPPDDSPDTANPFQMIAAENALTDIGVVKLGGKSLHRLHMSELPNADQFLKSAGLSGTIDTFSFDAYVTDAGVPVQIVIKMKVSMGSGSATVSMSFNFSNWGKAVRIVAPKV
jgi:hypothetical protein